MDSSFFVHKMREVGSFLKIIRGKLFGNRQDRVDGVDEALNAMKDEQSVYLKEKREALNDQPTAGQNKVLRQSGGQDVTAI